MTNKTTKQNNTTKYSQGILTTCSRFYVNVNNSLHLSIITTAWEIYVQTRKETVLQGPTTSMVW